jgi:hypothetical protein
MAKPARQFRVGGSKFTAFHWDGHLIAHCNQVAHTTPTPVAEAVPIQPIGARRPLEIITANAIGMGTLVLEIVELYGHAVWEELFSLADAILESTGTDGTRQNDHTRNENNHTDLADMFNAVASTPTQINVTKYVYPPAGSKQAPYHESYFNCVISNFQDGETITIGSMQIYKQITINYTHYKRSDTN